jgi:hypothetical protein
MTRLTRRLATSSFAPKDRHAGIKARSSSNGKREEKPRLADSLLATAQTVFGKVKCVAHTLGLSRCSKHIAF